MTYAGHEASPFAGSQAQGACKPTAANKNPKAAKAALTQQQQQLAGAGAPRGPLRNGKAQAAKAGKAPAQAAKAGKAPAQAAKAGKAQAQAAKAGKAQAAKAGNASAQAAKAGQVPARLQAVRGKQ